MWGILAFGVTCLAAYCGVVLFFVAHNDAVRAREEREMREADEASIGVCGTLVGTEVCCHTFLQQSAIAVEVADKRRGADGPLLFQPKTREAADWMRVPLSQAIESRPGSQRDDL